MGNVSYSAHISNGSSAIRTKGKLKAVANHNLRKYRSLDYNRDQIVLLYGTTNLYKDVQDVYHREFDEALAEYNRKQKRADRRIGNYMDDVEGKNRDIAVEMIVQLGDMEFWQTGKYDRDRMKEIFPLLLEEIMTQIPDFKIANAVIHFDEASPHMHIVGVPVADGYKNGLRKQVAKRRVFSQEILREKLQGEVREYADDLMSQNYGESLKDKKQGKNADLTVAQYKTKQETEKLGRLQNAVEKEEAELAEIDRNVTDKREELSDIAVQAIIAKMSYKSNEQKKKDKLADLDRWIQRKEDISREADEELDKQIAEVSRLAKIVGQIQSFVDSFHLFAPTIEKYASCVEQNLRIEAGNSFRGILSELGRLLESFKEQITEGICWFPRLMRWNTSKGEAAPVFEERSGGYDYVICGYRNVQTREWYDKADVQAEICVEARVGTVEQMDANIAAIAEDIREILRIEGEQRRLWEAYEEYKTTHNR